MLSQKLPFRHHRSGLSLRKFESHYCYETCHPFEDSESLAIKIPYKQKDLSMTVSVDSVIPTMVFPDLP